ncbi:transcription factor IIIA-like [Trifolium pratense]|uniref:transcription factor IIIA-like n=1 Tax=Trifolium pratense TaxID=57577 RepID=UPI001E69406C|nr:transcription factor IIIA-like [Trifolium pratense]
MADSFESNKRPIFRDIRRYFCDYCGISRSKKTLITSHINSHHQVEVEKAGLQRDQEAQGIKSNTCKECGASFRKPAYLLQHMQSHSLERPYICTFDGCQVSYRRKDHLNRHLLQHEGKKFKCPIENCNRDFSFEGNVTRHVKQFHNKDSSTSIDVKIQKQHVCPEIGCGKVFKFASKLEKHKDSHVKLESIETVCLYPGCMKHFTSIQCLRAHTKSCHQYVTCETCGEKQLEKNIKRHLRKHENGSSSEVFDCDYKGCSCTFSSKSNLSKHVKAIHLQDKPYMCSFPDCGMKFAYKHVRDNHEKSGSHVFTLGDFEETDEQFRSRNRGGRKRKCPTVEMLIRKRVAPPTQLEVLMKGIDIE